MNPTRIAGAIGQVESQGNYSAVGPATSTGDQAYGKYQVMGANIPQWTREAIGKTLTPEQFLQNPVAQDAVANTKVGQLFSKYGNPQDVASAWFSGRPQSQAGNASDVTGTTVPSYVSNVMRALGGGVANADTVNQYQPLTQDQFQKAQSAGYSTQQIIQFEQQRKAGGQGNQPTQMQQDSGVPSSNNGLLSQIGSSIGNAFTGGVQQAQSGFNQQMNAQNPGDLISGGLKSAAGVVNAATSPLAPLFAPVGQAVNSIADKISNSPQVQQFSQSPLGNFMSGAAENIGNAATIAGGVAGLRGGAPPLKSGLATGADVLQSSADTSIANARSQFVQELVTPKQTPTVLTDEIARGNVSEGGLLFKERAIAPTPFSQKVADTVNAIPAVHSGNTILENVNAVHDAIGATAQDLRTQLQTNPIIFPKQELMSYMDKAKSDLENNPLIVGDAVKTGQKILNKFQQLVNDNPGTGEGVLNARQQLDKWASSQKGDSVFDPAKESAVSIALRAVRQSANEFLAQKATNVPVKQLLSKQADMYNAIDAMAPKAAEEASSKFGRVAQRLGTILGTKSRLVQETAMLSGIGGLGAASFFAPPVAAILGAGLFGYGVKTAVMSPLLRQIAAAGMRGASNVIPNIK